MRLLFTILFSFFVGITSVFVSNGDLVSANNYVLYVILVISIYNLTKD